MAHPALTQDSVAVVTGGGAGIGLAVAQRFAGLGMAVAIADIRQDVLDHASEKLRSAGARDVLAQQTDVSDRGSLGDLEKEVAQKFSLGYPKDNILFQAPEQMIIWQDNQEVFNETIAKPQYLVDGLKLFFEYQPPAYRTP